MLKSLFRLFGVTACLSTVLFVNGQDTQLECPVVLGGGKPFRLNIDGNSDKQMEIRIEDNTGRVLHEGFLQSLQRFSRKYTFDDIAIGEYFVILESRLTRQVQPVLLGERQIEIDCRRMVEQTKPLVSN